MMKQRMGRMPDNVVRRIAQHGACRWIDEGNAASVIDPVKTGRTRVQDMRRLGLGFAQGFGPLRHQFFEMAPVLLKLGFVPLAFGNIAPDDDHGLAISLAIEQRHLDDIEIDALTIAGLDPLLTAIERTATGPGLVIAALTGIERGNAEFGIGLALPGLAGQTKDAQADIIGNQPAPAPILEDDGIGHRLDQRTQLRFALGQHPLAAVVPGLQAQQIGAQQSGTATGNRRP